MSAEAAAVLPRKLSKPKGARSKSDFSPDMLRKFCDRAGAALSILLGERTIVTLDSIGVEPIGDVLPNPGEPVCAAVAGLNNIVRAAVVLPDNAMQFHIADLMLGGDVMIDEPIPTRAPSKLDQNFCKTLSDLLMTALADTCNAVIGPERCHYSGRIALVDDVEDLAIVPRTADIMVIKIEAAFGLAGRRGGVAIQVPLSTIDAISSTSAGKGEMVIEEGPWFTHMKSTVAEIEMEALALLHTERMSLAALSRLDIGSILPLNDDAITSVAIMLEEGGDIIASGELGIHSGKRAISLDNPPDEGFFAPIRSLL